MTTRRLRPTALIVLCFFLAGLFPGMSTAQPHSLTVYTDPNYAGSICYSDTPMGANIHVSCNDKISSIQLAPGWSVRLYPDQNQGGSSLCLNRNDADLSNNTFENGSSANDTISSFILYNTPWCGGSPTPAYPLEVYTDPSYAGGWCYSSQAETENIHTSCDNRISSILLRTGWSIRVYRDQNQTGPDRCLSASDNNLSDNTFADGSPLNDTISSFVLYNQSNCPDTPPPPPPPSYAFEVYTDPDYGGAMCYSNAPITANIHYTCNDRISSLKLRSGWSVRVYRDLAQGGPGRCLTASDTDLRNNTFEDGSSLNDTISSFVLYRQSSCPTTPPPPEHPPVELTGIEITQSVQNLRNDTVLLAGRRTIVRAHVRSSATVYGVIAELVGTRNGQPLPGSPLRARNLGGRVRVISAPNRIALNDSFYFELPSSWRSGNVELEVRGITDPLVCRDAAGTPGDCRSTARFQPSPAIEVRLVGIIWREGGRIHQPSWEEIRTVARQIDSTLPVPYVAWDRPYDIEPLFFAGAPSTLGDFIRLNNMLRIQRWMDGCGSTCRRYYLGVIVDQPASAQLNGLAYDIPADVATAYLTDRFTHPHELGHTLGRYHVRCTGDEVGPDNSYPYANGLISSDMSGNGAFYGFDLNTYPYQIYKPTSGDLMSYCQTRWISDYTFKGMRNYLASRYGYAPVFADAPATILSAEQPAIVITGVVSPTEESGIISSIYQVPAPVQADAPVEGAYSIIYEDASGTVLSNYPFVPEAMSEGNLQGFSLLLPWNAQAQRIVLLHGEHELDQRIVSSSTPTVTSINVPNGSVSTGDITWTADDPDGDDLSYVVQYSADDGTTWNTLTAEWTKQHYSLPLNQLPGSTRVRVRIYASDGVLTSEAVSEPFTVTREPPQPVIESPAPGSLLVEAQPLLLEGSAYDKDDGPIPGEKLTWTSNLDGNLGTGESLNIDVSLLHEGEHTISLIATDSDGQTAVITTTIQVAHERPALPPGLAVVPTRLDFVVQEGRTMTETESLVIRNDGDGDLDWTASADQAWIKLGATSGTDDFLTVSFDATDLQAGTYTGTVTVMGAGGQAGTQTIEVNLLVTERLKIYLPFLVR